MHLALVLYSASEKMVLVAVGGANCLNKHRLFNGKLTRLLQNGNNYFCGITTDSKVHDGAGFKCKRELV